MIGKETTVLFKGTSLAFAYSDLGKSWKSLIWMVRVGFDPLSPWIWVQYFATLLYKLVQITRLIDMYICKKKEMIPMLTLVIHPALLFQSITFVTLFLYFIFVLHLLSYRETDRSSRYVHLIFYVPSLINRSAQFTRW